MASGRKPSKADLLAEVIGVGAGNVPESALESKQGLAEARRPMGRPRKDPTIPFTLRLKQESAELLQKLTGELQARAVRGELPRSEATFAAVVEEGLRLYATKHSDSG